MSVFTYLYYAKSGHQSFGPVLLAPKALSPHMFKRIFILSLKSTATDYHQINHQEAHHHEWIPPKLCSVRPVCLHKSQTYFQPSVNSFYMPQWIRPPTPQIRRPLPTNKEEINPCGVIDTGGIVRLLLFQCFYFHSKTGNVIALVDLSIWSP